MLLFFSRAVARRQGGDEFGACGAAPMLFIDRMAPSVVEALLDARIDGVVVRAQDDAHLGGGHHAAPWTRAELGGALKLLSQV